MRDGIIFEDTERVIASNLEWTALEGKTILITGAAGFLPSYMVEVLLRLSEAHAGKNLQVIALDFNAENCRTRFSRYANRSDLTVIEHDASEELVIDTKIDYIVHAASLASPKYFGKAPVETYSANTLGTHRMLSLAHSNAVQSFLYFSSSEIYGELDDSQIPTPESTLGLVDTTDVRSSYAESKRMGETMCVSWHKQFNVPAKIVRPFHTYGPGMRLDDGRVFADFVANIVNGQNILMRSDGKASRAFCYLADAVEGFFCVLLRGKSGEAYNMGNDKAETTVLELANTLVGLFPEKNLEVIMHSLAQPPGYLQSRVSRSCPDISKLKALGWLPTTSIEEGFARTIRSYL